MPIWKAKTTGLVCILCFACQAAFAQERKVIQFSGIIQTEISGRYVPLPYVSVGILRTSRGGYSDERGFFSMAARLGDTILVQYLGYKTQYLQLPFVVPGDHYHAMIYMMPDTVQLERAIVYPIPSREHFKTEFLQMDVSDKMKEIARENLAQDVLNRIEPGVAADGRAGVSLYLAQEAQKAYYDGQIKPQRIFDPMAWIEFFKALKRGDFKRKKPE
ncbi:MAG TPA: hypothetical protein VFX48_03755 [Saprospiraceae bacterium]|nr:hypothetical protein [Saprospiraceae bacterium]